MNKIIWVLILLIWQGQSLFSQQWIGLNNPTGSIYRNGRVGIGMNIPPNQRLQLKNGNLLLDYGQAGSTGNIYFGGVTNLSQEGMRMFYYKTIGGLLDVKATNPSEGLVIRVDNNIGGTERMRVTANGKVGIGTSNPSYQLDVNGNGRFTTTLEVQGKVSWAPSKFSTYSPDSETAIAAFSAKGNGAYLEGAVNGVLGVAGAHTTGGLPPPEAIGVWGIGGGIASDKSVGVHGDGMGSKYAIGLWGQANGGNVANYAVWGDLDGGSGFAGYFSGDVYTTTSYLPSDAVLKKNIRPLNNALASISKLNVYQFTFNSEKFPTLHLPSQEQYGLIAEEVEKVFPELVKKTIQPSRTDSTGTSLEDVVTFNSVNYNALIPILIQSVKELQIEIELLKQEIAELKSNKGRKRRKK